MVHSPLPAPSLRGGEDEPSHVLEGARRGTHPPAQVGRTKKRRKAFSKLEAQLPPRCHLCDCHHLPWRALRVTFTLSPLASMSIGGIWP